MHVVCKQGAGRNKPSGGGRPYRARYQPRRVYIARPGRNQHTLLCVAVRFASPPHSVSRQHIMAAKFVVLFACIALAQGAMVRRDAPDFFKDIEHHTKEFHKTLEQQFNSLTKSKDAQDFSKAWKDGSESVLQQLNAFAKSLQGALGDANGKAKEALEQSRQNIERTAEELRKAHPDVEKNATALREKLQAAVQNTVQESQKLAKKVSSNVQETNEKLAPKIKAAYDDFAKNTQEVIKKIQEAANAKQ
ncbi:apolipophorin III isoform X2 [Bombyx mori]|uniref:Apolipophorin-III n=1 Tax=Bombyx mori TaxID=7091 RepID=A0A8R2R402_BOMMO|nr:apolipophorin III isoform X2 [Bombyx mori]